ncbi:MAG: tetraacyldisaccharide 4'-kinase, partial [Burkholderiaceae bacterium]|nr:tetraacyldisaccharide 4'-kinase [Burkholderiaceae bacterium]
PLDTTLSLPDHHNFAEGRALFAGIEAEAILVTEKDAIKCAALDPRLWVVPLQCRVPQAALERLAERLRAAPAHGAARAPAPRSSSS